MASRTLTLRCDLAVKNLLCGAIRDYAHAAYPEGGSECAQVARYALLQAADAIDAAVSSGHPEAVVSRRLRAMLQAAVDYHFNREDAASGSASIRQRALLTGLLEGRPLTCAELGEAAASDGGTGS
jgi:hypothetical protein